MPKVQRQDSDNSRVPSILLLRPSAPCVAMSARFGTTVASLKNVPLTAQDLTTQESGGPAEQENQFVLRLPDEPAQALREALRSGTSNVRDRLRIKLEPDRNSSNPQLRRGQVVFDGWEMSAKMVDLPTVRKKSLLYDVFSV